jgi:TIR domain
MSNATDLKPAPYYFISYSRQEVTFVDNFSRELQKRGIRNWVDFRNLVPGRSWQPQLDEAIKNADAILLVVSKASMSSLPVKDEWTKSLAAGKRIILIIFGPCKLNPVLAGLEWVDFTKPFDRAMDQLITLQARPSQTATEPLPEKRLHLPGVAVASVLLNLLLVFFLLFQPGLFLAWFIGHFYGVSAATAAFESSPVLPAILLIWLSFMAYFLQLPVPIVRRTHNAQTIRNALYALLALTLVLLIFTFISQVAVSPVEADEVYRMGLSLIYYVLTALYLFTIIAVVLFILLLKSDGMYRWFGPKGAFLRVAPPDLAGHTDHGIAMRVLVEAAPQDLLYSRDLKDSITKAGHICTDNAQNADIVLPLLSTYKTGSAYDPETIRLIPILIQSCDVDQRLSRLQWVDLRYGKISMDAVAYLLDEPQELLRLLGVLPIRTVILPDAVNLLNNLITICLVAVFISAISLISSAFSNLGSTAEVQSGLILLHLILLTGYFLLGRYITHRRVRYRSFMPYGSAVAFATLLSVVGSLISLRLLPLLLMFWLIPMLMLRKDVRKWLPPGAKGQILPR